MANVQLGSININFTNSKDADPANLDGDAELGTPANYASITAMRTRLAAISGTYYTTARLDAMGVNDMVYALRMCDDPTTVANYISAVTP